jgi:hypothetical protein
MVIVAIRMPLPPVRLRHSTRSEVGVVAHRDPEETDDDPVLTPGGFRPRDQVHQVAPGATVRFDQDGRPVREEQQDEQEAAHDDEGNQR